MATLVHLTATLSGGAGIAARQLHEALLGVGHMSHMMTDHGEGGIGINVVGGGVAAVGRAFSKARFKTFTHPRYYFRDQRYDRHDRIGMTGRLKSLQPGAIVCHAITNFVSFPTIADAAEITGARVLWSLMDMASLTGGCHYAWDCVGYQQTCGHCPALRLSSANDWSARTFAEKKLALTRMKSVVVAASSQLASQARSSALFADTPVAVIPLSVPPELFRPRDPRALRADFEIAPDRQVLLFGARDLHDARKGMMVMHEALNRLADVLPEDRLPSLLITGDGAAFEALAGRGFPIRQLGLVSLEKLASAYAAADVFISPSLEDSGPMMINQAVMSGVPVIAFPVGVAPDLIRHEETGLLAPCGDAAALAAAIRAFLEWDEPRRATARGVAREIGLAHCSPYVQASAFAELAVCEEPA